MFGQGNNDWGGAESIDPDVEQVVAESRTNAVPRASQGSHGATTDFEVVPAAQRRADNKSSFVTSQNADPDPDSVQRPSTTNLKDLFAPREEQGFSLIGHLDLDSELDIDLDEPAFGNNAPATTPIAISASDPSTTTRSAAAPAPTRTHQARAVDATLPFFFPQNARARGYHVRRAKFGRTDDEMQIRERWEGVRAELTREWKRRHREAVKSRRRRGGARGERAE